LCGPESVRATLEKLGVLHVSHGIRAAEDPDLVRDLAKRGTFLHTCPTSNVCLGVYKDLANHPLRNLLREGCNVTLNSDDPALFGVSITDEYMNGVRHLRLSGIEIARLARNAFDAADLDANTRNDLCGEVASFLESSSARTDR
jgi:adenosine deaminase